jgi:nucleoside-diphosphate-sugar epimerase
MVYGPAQQDLSKLIPYVILSLLQGKSPSISSGDRMIDWIYVNDVVEAYLALAKVPGIEGQTLEIGSGELVSIREIVDQVAGLVSGPAKPKYGALADRPMEPLRIADIARTRDLIEWAPRTPLKEGLSRTVEWYRNNMRALVK